LSVGFPGETDEDFEATLELVRDVGFVDSFLFKYSPRPGTSAAQSAESQRISNSVAQERLEALQNLQRQLTLIAHRKRVGTTTEVLLEGESRRGGQPCGRDPYHRVINLLSSSPALPPGSLVQVQLLEATPHSLLGEPLLGPPLGAPLNQTSSSPSIPQ